MSDRIWLSRALELADSRRGFCAPNPSVGCVIVQGDEVVGEGAHEKCGAAHAEAAALLMAGDRARGATAYITLEPCSHWGRTPPCADSLLEAGIARVIFGYVDPDARVRGTGANRLREAGIECAHLASPSIDSFYESYASWKQTGRPVVTAKLAMSLDGKIAAIAGKRTALSGEEASSLTMFHRRRTDAILTTAATVLADDPELTARGTGEPVRKPLFVVDRRLVLTAERAIFRTASSLTLLHGKSAPEDVRRDLEAAGARCVEIRETDRGLDLESVVAYVGETGAHDLWVEAGGSCVESLVRLGALKRLLIYVTPRWIGAAGLAAFSDGFDPLKGASRVQWRSLGADALCDAKWS